MKLYLLIIGIIISKLTFTQNDEGYYGNKHFISLETVFYSPIIYNIVENSNLDQNNLSVKDHINYGFHGSITQLIKRNFAFTFDFGIEYGSVYSDSYVNIFSMNKQSDFKDDGYYLALSEHSSNYEQSMSNETFESSLYVNQENIDTRTFSFMPKFEIATKNALLPLGLSHHIGLGFSSTKIIEREYVYSMNNTTEILLPTSLEYVDANTFYKDHMYDFKNAKNILNYTFLYAIYKRTPITKNLMIQYGIKYTFNFHSPYKYDVSEFDSPYFYTNNDMRHLINSQKSFNVMSATVGLTYVFK